jgi:hypothetical protein
MITPSTVALVAALQAAAVTIVLLSSGLLSCLAALALAGAAAALTPIG